MRSAHSDVAHRSDLKHQYKDRRLYVTLSRQAHKPSKNDGDDHSSIGIWVILNSLSTTIKPKSR